MSLVLLPAFDRSTVCVQGICLNGGLQGEGSAMLADYFINENREIIILLRADLPLWLLVLILEDMCSNSDINNIINL